jgi:hypothetical protein
MCTVDYFHSNYQLSFWRRYQEQYALPEAFSSEAPSVAARDIVNISLHSILLKNRPFLYMIYLASVTLLMKSVNKLVIKFISSEILLFQFHQFFTFS